ncbi:protease complex subunit PrcB family protein [Anaeromyxobacter terrae]|uniref:protease complex subunit PrcB family protein n=1 Tax=Anaeromyxobacter terrae TaxID=2925406 RepID=UPI001F57EC2C|nr:protease complex subunit PrcB family protein [Anaeromyxobacter sp. SG22]
MVRSSALAVTLALLAACGGAASGPDQQPSGIVLPQATELSSPYSAFTGPSRLVVRDEPTWAEAWATIHGPVSELPPLPAVDFSREMVLVAAIGQRPSGGYTVTFSAVTAVGDGLRATVQESAPGPGCGTATVITSPVVAIRVPRVEGAVQFVDGPVVRPGC